MQCLPSDHIFQHCDNKPFQCLVWKTVGEWDTPIRQNREMSLSRQLVEDSAAAHCRRFYVLAVSINH